MGSDASFSEMQPKPDMGLSRIEPEMEVAGGKYDSETATYGLVHLANIFAMHQV